MSNRLTVYTVPHPETPEAYKGGTYRRIIGLEHNGDAVWLPDADRDAAARHDFDVPLALASNALDYLDRHYVRQPNLVRDCHIGAAALTGHGQLSWVDALALANRVLTNSRPVEADELPVLAHGVMGGFVMGSPMASHSVVGIAPGLGIQTDSDKGPLSLVSHSHNLQHYKSHSKIPDYKMYKE